MASMSNWEYHLSNILLRYLKILKEQELFMIADCSICVRGMESRLIQPINRNKYKLMVKQNLMVDLIAIMNKICFALGKSLRFCEKLKTEKLEHSKTVLGVSEEISLRMENLKG